MQTNKQDAMSTLYVSIQRANSIENDSKRSEALAEIAELQAKYEEFDAAMDTSKYIIVDRNVHLYNIIKAMVQAGDREEFKKALVSSAQDVHTAYQVAGLLFEIYKDQSRLLSETIRRLV